MRICIPRGRDRVRDRVRVALSVPLRARLQLRLRLFRGRRPGRVSDLGGGGDNRDMGGGGLQPCARQRPRCQRDTWPARQRHIADGRHVTGKRQTRPAQW